MSSSAARKSDSAPLGGSFGASAAENSLVNWKTTFCAGATIRPLCTVSRTHILLCPAPVSAGHGGGPVWAAMGSSLPTSKAAQIPQGEPPQNWNLRLKIYSPNILSEYCNRILSAQILDTTFHGLISSLCGLAGGITRHRRIPCQPQPRQWSCRFLVIHKNLSVPRS
jgi:hypothetical protein